MKNLRLDLQFFAEETEADLLSYLGISTDTNNNEGAEDNNQSTNTDDADGTAANNAGDQNTEGANSEGDANKDNTEGDKSKGTDEAKAQHAFAKLRAENAQNKQLLNGLQKLLNIPENTPIEDVMAKVQESIVKAQSKQTGIPEEFLNRMNALEQRDREFRASQLKEKTYLGLNKVQKDYGLTPEQVKGFAVELMNDGMNPFEQDVDIVREYQVRHFEDIINARVAEGIRKEQERAAKATNQGTVPGNKQGQQKGETGKVNSVKELDNWFNENSK